MVVNLNTGEYIAISEITSTEEKKEFLKSKPETLTIIWNILENNTIKVNNEKINIAPNEIYFLTELHQINLDETLVFRSIVFNRSFYCIANHDSEIGCKGHLFFGASALPNIKLENENIAMFNLLWQVFQVEKATTDNLQLEMLQMLLKRFLILSTRIFKEQHTTQEFQENKLDIIRDFYYLVENNFKKLHAVNDYANLMNKPAKSLSNYFAKKYTKKPLQIIQDRIVIEAKRNLVNTNLSVKEIAFDLGFEDLQSFSRFFKNKTTTSPKEFRAKQENSY